MTVTEGIVITLITAAVGFLTLVYKTRAERKNKSETTTDEKIDKLLVGMGELREQTDELSEGQIAVIKDRIVQAHRYYTAQGDISMHDFQTLSGLYDRYYKVHKNTFVRELWEDIQELKKK